ncbi:MAG: SAM-dependent methyltransferase, partial [Alphaproteobacteria bacterium]
MATSRPDDIPASAWVARFAPQVPAGTVLDLAAGSGRHSLLMRGLGHAVVAVDRDPSTLAARAVPGI